MADPILSRASTRRVVLLVGCGHAGARHLRCILALGVDVDIVLCDPDDAALATNSGPDVIASCTSLDEAWAHFEATGRAPSWVIIATPSGLHVEQVEETWRRFDEASVLVEKPVGVDPRALDRLAARSAEVKGRLVAVQPLLLQPTVEAAHALVTSGALGAPVAASLRLHLPRDTQYFEAKPWRGSRRMDGGVLLNQTYHLLGVMQRLLGPLSPRACVMSSLRHAVESGDTAAAILSTASGAPVTVSATLACELNHQAELHISGRRHALTLGGMLLDQTERWVEGVERGTPFKNTEALYMALHRALWSSGDHAGLDDGLEASMLAAELTALAWRS